MIAWLLKQYRIIDPKTPDPITTFTKDVRAVICKYGLTLPKKTASKAEKAQWKDFCAKKAQYLAPHLTKTWMKWSNTTYAYFPFRAFSKNQPEAVDILDYLLVSFSYDVEKDKFKTTITLVQDADDDDDETNEDDSMSIDLDTDDDMGDADEKVDTDEDVPRVDTDNDDDLEAGLQAGGNPPASTSVKYRSQLFRQPLEPIRHQSSDSSDDDWRSRWCFLLLGFTKHQDCIQYDNQYDTCD